MGAVHVVVLTREREAGISLTNCNKKFVMNADGRDQLNMTDLKVMHMTVSIDVQPEGLNLCCWFSPDQTINYDTIAFPFTKVYYGDFCMWRVHSSHQMTLKVYAMVTEYADKICAEQRAKNATRKLANR